MRDAVGMEPKRSENLALLMRTRWPLITGQEAVKCSVEANVRRRVRNAKGALERAAEAVRARGYAFTPKNSSE